jgi:hemoglobin
MRPRPLLLAALLCCALVAPPPSRAAGGELFRALGERAGIERIVDGAVARWLADPRIRKDFEDTNIPRLRARLIEQVCALADGPCRYSGHDMRAAHAGLHVTEARFNALVEDLQDAMDAAGVPFATQNRLLALLAPMRRDVMGE